MHVSRIALLVVVLLGGSLATLAALDRGDLTIGTDRTISFAAETQQPGVLAPCPDNYYCDGPGTEIQEAYWEGNTLHSYAEIIPGTEFRSLYPCQDTSAETKGSVLVHAVEGPEGQQEMDAVVEAVFSYFLYCDREIAWTDDPTPTVVSAYYTSGIYEYPPSQSNAQAQAGLMLSGPCSEGGLVEGDGWPWSESDVVTTSSLITVKAGYDYKFSWTAVARCCESHHVRATWAWSRAELTVHSIRVHFVAQTENKRPIAVAAVGEAGSVPIESVEWFAPYNEIVDIQLDGTKSKDPEGQPLTYLWCIDDQPREGSAYLSDIRSAQPVLRVADPGNYRVSLVVNDGELTSEIDSVDITVAFVGTPPTAPAWRENLQRGDLIFYRSEGRFADFLSLLGKHYTHVGIYLGNGFVLDSDKENGGVGIRLVSIWDRQHDAGAYRIRSATSEQLDQFIAFAASKYTQPYDIHYWQRSAEEDDWYCSEIVWASAKLIGVQLGTEGWWAISPDDLIHYDYVNNSGVLERVGYYGKSYEQHIAENPDGLADPLGDTPLSKAIGVIAHCPVAISVTDPLGRLVAKSETAIPDAVYSEFDLNCDDKRDSAVAIPVTSRMSGIYCITVIPSESALPTDTYTLRFRIDGEEVILAENVAVADIPPEPYHCGVSPLPTASVFRLNSWGDVFVDQTLYGLAFQTEAADIAEWVLVSGPVESGDILEIDPNSVNKYRKSRAACSRLVAGVVSTDPGVMLGASGRLGGQALLALSGIVPVKVTDEGGPIQPGDLLVTSSTPGHAMRWAGPGFCPCSMVGKALEPMGEKQGVILVLLTAH